MSMLMTASDELMHKVSCAIADGRPVFVLDEQMVCLMSGCRERLDHGECLSRFLLSVRLAEKEIYEGPFLRLGRSYCVRYMQVQDIYVGEILSANELSLLVDNTDGVGGSLALYSSMEHDLSSVWRIKHQLDAELADCSETVRRLLYRMERPLYRISANSRNIYEYFSMICTPPVRTAVNVVSLCERIAGSCNECLVSVGRHIECCLPRGEKLYIRSDIRHATAAVINAIQNALLYSPKSCVPTLEIRSTGRTVSIIIKNTNVLFGKEPQPDISSMRVGYGIPIIRRFVVHAKGELELSLEDVTATVTMTLPIAAEEEITEYALEEADEGAEYDAGVPDYITLQMLQVTEYYEEAP